MVCFTAFLSSPYFFLTCCTSQCNLQSLQRQLTSISQRRTEGPSRLTPATRHPQRHACTHAHAHAWKPTCRDACAEKADLSGCGRPMDLGLRARYREKGNNFMPKCIKEEYTGNKSKQFFHPDRLQQLPSPL